MAELGYKVDTEKPETSFDVLPAGEYLVVIESSDLIDTKESTGKILKLTYQILDSAYKGKKLFEQLNIINKSTVAQEIARKTLNSIGIATGVFDIRDSSQLHNIPFKVDVGVKEDKTYGMQNRIKKHIKIINDEASILIKTEPAQSPATPVAPKTQPWEAVKK